MVSGKKMPVDSKAENMVFVSERPDMSGPMATKHEVGEMVKVYRPHWGTCPLAKQFKKKKKGD
jgi:hypothetical protein